MISVRRFMAVLLALTMVFCLASCTKTAGGGETESQAPEKAVVGEDFEAEVEIETIIEDGYEIAYILTDVIDGGSYDEQIYTEISQYATDYGRTFNNYVASDVSDEAIAAAMNAALEEHAKIIIACGWRYILPLVETAQANPEVMFLGIDMAPGDIRTELPENLAVISFDEAQGGYLAGYAAVMDGSFKLGVIGDSVTSGYGYGYGFVQGADAAAQDLETNVEVEYWVAEALGENDSITEKAAVWYENGTEIIFAICEGDAYKSVVSAAEAADAEVICVDVDRSGHSSSIVTSVVKNYAFVTNQALIALHDNSGVWPSDYAGQGQVFGAMRDMIWLSGTQEASYEMALTKLQAGDIEVTEEMPSLSSYTTLNME